MVARSSITPYTQGTPITTPIPQLMIDAFPFPTMLPAHGGGSLRVSAAFTALTGYRREAVPMFTVLSERMKPTDDTGHGDQPSYPDGAPVIATANGGRRFVGRSAATRPDVSS